jgi:hypothetical protein
MRTEIETDRNSTNNIMNVIDSPNRYLSENDARIRIGRQILEEEIFPGIRYEIKESAKVQKMWNIFAGIFITFKYLCHAAATIFAFLALSPTIISKPENWSLGIVGILNVTSVACEQLGRYCVSNSKKRLDARNKLIESLGIRYREPDVNFRDPAIEESTTHEPISNPNTNPN